MYPPPASLHTEVQTLARTHSTSAVTPAAPAEPPAEVKVTYMLLPLEEVAAGVTAAKRGASVIATDVNAAAVGAARGNAWLAGVSVDAREGDLFVPVIGERFDLVLFNPPFFDDAPPPPGLDARAWRGVGVFERFVAGLRDHLAPGGAALVVASTDGGGPGWPGALRAAGFDVDVAGSRAWPDETVDVLRVR